MAAIEIMQVCYFCLGSVRLRPHKSFIAHKLSNRSKWHQNYYPERLGKALMINVPYLFMKAWKMIYPFIDNNTRAKVIVDIFL